MSDSSTKHPPGVEDLLAPPPFGVAETTGDQLLPIATSMEHVLGEDRLPEPEPEPAIAPEPEPASVPAASELAAATTPASAHVEDAPEDSKRTVVVVAVVVLLLGAGAFFWMDRGSDVEGEQPGQTVASAASPAGGVAPGETPKAVPPGGQASAAALPSDLAALRKLSFEERHAGLAQMSGDVPVELHVGLDLVQAQESDEPCRTFSDALSIIESSEDPSTFGWAVDEASVPSEPEAASCKGLAERLAAAQGPGAADEAPKPRPVVRNKKGSTRRKPRPSRPTPAADPPPPADPPKTTEPAKPKPSPARAPSVATKLDDDLRGLGE